MKTLLLHGAIGCKDQFTSLKNELEILGHEVYSFNFSGHGDSTLPETPFTIEKFKKELVQFVQLHTLENCIVFGYSMGGYIALYTAIEYPALFSKIVTLGTKLNWSPEIAAQEIKNVNPQKIKEKVPAFAEKLEKAHGSTWSQLLEKTAKFMLHLGKDTPLNNETLTQISTPIVLGLADHDAMVTLDETRNAFKQLPNASMFMIPNAKHPIETVDCNLLAKILSNSI
jgi:pimeloyl-ACP methyl ester carboxylesterase